MFKSFCVAGVLVSKMMTTVNNTSSEGMIRFDAIQTQSE